MNKSKTTATEANELDLLAKIKKPIVIGHTTFEFDEPTLAVLDLMSREWVKLPAIDTRATNDEIIANSKENVIQYAKCISRSLAIGIVGEKVFSFGGWRRVKHLEKFIYRHITARQLRQAAIELTTGAGLVDFTISMKLMSTARTTAKATEVE